MQKLFKYSYKAEIEIEAKPEAIWKALKDLQSYHLWNPFTPKIETDWKLGSKVLLTVNMKKGSKAIIQTEYLTRLDPPYEFAWGMNWGFLLKAERVQKLVRSSDGKTKYFTEDIIHGLLSPIVHLIYGKSIQNGFEQVADSLKKYVERD